MFCDAMVTMKSGKAIPTSPARVKSGITNSIGGAMELPRSTKAFGGKSIPKIITQIKANRAAGTASRRLIRPTTSHAITMGRPNSGSKATALTGARQRPSNTPASIALASGVGIPATARPKGFQTPLMMIRMAQMIKAPTATAKPPSIAPDVARRAAPGVDQAMLIGSFVLSDKTIAQSPMERDSAINPDAACSGVAPTAVNPCKTTANELADPTNPANRPMKILWGEISRSMVAPAFIWKIRAVGINQGEDPNVKSLNSPVQKTVPGNEDCFSDH